MDSSLISACAGLLGALIGGGATLLGAQLEHNRQTRAGATKAHTERVEQAARQCDQLIRELQRTAERMRSNSGRSWAVQRQLRNEYDSAIREIGVQALFLPQEFRDRLLLLADIIDLIDWIRDGSQLGGAHYHGQFQIVYNVCTDARSVIAALLRGDKMPRYGKFIDEYEVALRNARVDHDDLSDVQLDDDSHYQTAKSDFYRRHPELTSDQAGTSDTEP
jgi:hypothetical protein